MYDNDGPASKSANCAPGRIKAERSRADEDEILRRAKVIQAARKAERLSK
jgi:hypothetical protein